MQILKKSSLVDLLNHNKSGYWWLYKSHYKIGTVLTLTSNHVLVLYLLGSIFLLEHLAF